MPGTGKYPFGRSITPGQHSATDGLQHAFAALGEFEFRWAGGREFDELVVQEGNPGFESVGHRHVVDPFDRIVDEHHFGVDAQRGIHCGLRRGRTCGRLRNHAPGRRRAGSPEPAPRPVRRHRDRRTPWRKVPTASSRGTPASGGYQ